MRFNKILIFSFMTSLIITRSLIACDRGFDSLRLPMLNGKTATRPTKIKEENVGKVLSFIISQGTKGVTRREICSKCPLLGRWDVQPILNMLVEDGRITVTEEKSQRKYFAQMLDMNRQKPDSNTNTDYDKILRWVQEKSVRGSYEDLIDTIIVELTVERKTVIEALPSILKKCGYEIKPYVLTTQGYLSNQITRVAI